MVNSTKTSLGASQTLEGKRVRLKLGMRARLWQRKVVFAQLIRLSINKEQLGSLPGFLSGHFSSSLAMNWKQSVVTSSTFNKFNKTEQRVPNNKKK